VPARSASGSAFQRGGVVTVGAVTLAVVGGDVATVGATPTVVDVEASSAGRVVDVGDAVVLVTVVAEVDVDVDGVDVDVDSADVSTVVAPTSPEPPSQLEASSASRATTTADPRAGIARERRTRSIVTGPEIRGCKGPSLVVFITVTSGKLSRRTAEHPPAERPRCRRR
jgi:hypothetical protein